MAESEKKEQLPDDVGEVCEKHKQLIKGVIAGILKYNQMDIEDCYQDICIKLKNYEESCKTTLKEWPPPENLICTIAKRTAIDRWRSSNRYINALSKAYIKLRHIPKQAGNINNRIAGKKAWHMADQKCQKLFICKYKDGLSHEEIGLILGVTKGAISQRLKKCLDTLRDKLGVDI